MRVEALALAAKEEKASCARRERRRHVAEHWMAAVTKEKEEVHVQKRGGQKAWKNSVRRRYNQDLRRQKQRRQWRQAKNRQIWMRL